MQATFKERIVTIEEYEVWQSKYTFASWVTPCKLLNIKTNTYYYKGDLCFVLLSYVDNKGVSHWVNSLEDFIRI